MTLKKNVIGKIYECLIHFLYIFYLQCFTGDESRNTTSLNAFQHVMLCRAAIHADVLLFWGGLPLNHTFCCIMFHLAVFEHILYEHPIRNVAYWTQLINLIIQGFPKTNQSTNSLDNIFLLETYNVTLCYSAFLRVLLQLMHQCDGLSVCLGQTDSSQLSDFRGSMRLPPNHHQHHHPSGICTPRIQQAHFSNPILSKLPAQPSLSGSHGRRASRFFFFFFKKETITVHCVFNLAKQQHADSKTPI